LLCCFFFSLFFIFYPAFAAKSEAIIAKLARITEAKISRLRKLQSESGVRTRLNGEFIC